MGSVDNLTTIVALLASTSATPPVITARKGVVSVTRSAAGVFPVTLESGGADAAECVCFVSARGTTFGVGQVEHTSDTVKTVRMFDAAGMAADVDFDLLICQIRS